MISRANNTVQNCGKAHGLSRLRARSSDKYLICALALISGCATLPEDWSRRDTVLEVSFQVVNAVDAWQTTQIKDHAHLVEGASFTRSVLGENPDTGETVVYFATIGATHYLISRWLPAKWRPWFQAPTMYSPVKAVVNNCENGLC